MNEFLLIFRTDSKTMDAMQKRTPEESKANAERWMEWIQTISSKNKLVSVGNRLMPSGKIVKPEHIVIDGPYTEIKECLVGYTIVRAESLEAATVLTAGCPILSIGGSVEVRQIDSL